MQAGNTPACGLPTWIVGPRRPMRSLTSVVILKDVT